MPTPMPPVEHRFKPGQSGNPAGGVSGRTKALGVLDSIMADKGNQEKFREHMQQLFDKSPAAFWERFVVPLLPKQAQIDINAQQTLKLAYDDSATIQERAQQLAAAICERLGVSAGGNGHGDGQGIPPAQPNAEAG